MSQFRSFLQHTPDVVDLGVRVANAEEDPKELALDLLQMAFDLIGVVDPTPVSDGAGAVLALCRGRWLDAATSVASILPYVGDLAKAGKLPRYLKLIERVVNLIDRSAEAARALLPGLRKLEQALSLLPSAGNPLILQIKQRVRRTLARNGARAAKRFLPDISKKFIYETVTTATGEVRKSVKGRLGVPGRVKKHKRESKTHRRMNQEFGGDDASHLAALDFGAAPGIENLSPQNFRLNRKVNQYSKKHPKEEHPTTGGGYYALEDRWRERLKRGDGVEVEITDITRSGEKRPYVREAKYTYTYRDGTQETLTEFFPNTETRTSRALKKIPNTVPDDHPGADVLDFPYRNPKPR